MTDPNRTSVGDVPAPLMIDTQFGKVEVVADPSMRTGDPPKFVQTALAGEQMVYAIISDACAKSEKVGTDKERAAVVKYLRREADTIALRDGVANHLRVMAAAIETGDHLK